jgi:hypothetical protein
MDAAVAPRIGLALSGGGSRAIAFHLGCLRALNRLGLLDRVAILSTVSGGSVIGAYFHAHFHGQGGDFPSFEIKIRGLLRQGLAAPMCGKLFSVTALKVAAAFIAVGLVGLAITLIKILIKVARWVTPRGVAVHFERFEIRSPLHRFARGVILRVALGRFLRAIPRGPEPPRAALPAPTPRGVLGKEELSMHVGGGTTRPLTPQQVNRAIGLLRNGQEVHVESIGQMRQIQGELGQLGVRSESNSAFIPQRPAAGEIPGSFRDGPGTYRVDPPHGPGTLPYNSHNEYSHINITLRDGKTRTIIVTGTRSF